MGLEIEKKSLTDEEKKWLTNEFWPVPKWLEKDESSVQLKDYDSYYKYNLRTRYLELEGDFRTAYNNFYDKYFFDIVTASRIVDFLLIAKKALEGKDVNLLNVANVLDLIERYLIWIFPHYVVRQRIIIRANKLKSINADYSSILEDTIKKYDNPDELGYLRAIYDEVTGELNRITTQNHISFGLQIERLSLLRFWGIFILLISILVLPLVVNFDELSITGTFLSNIFNASSSDTISLFINWVLLLVFVLMGATGGFISGLLQIRNTRVNLIEFRESLLKFQLKPIVGGLTAALITVLLSWQILPGIKIESIGSFLLIAFLTGFSERYFLKLLKIEKEDSLQSNEIEDIRDLKMSKKDLSELPDPENQKIDHQSLTK
ncbi:hypothetical protein SYJ56_22400 [Algoriphagus sp. D3-2-R+10]|uniref:hypothetical protein n=1 Tax=Algoriphagus aurantiacus TaxID=3103948 RepID=UPI002B37F4F5|nr:hypothetical protein [Algoriphagus sp. D3-2-R+10]MEB2778081.1 hypothetical protein [Algoriphagus sp. D3-2-R+10]